MFGRFKLNNKIKDLEYMLRVKETINLALVSANASNFNRAELLSKELERVEESKNYHLGVAHRTTTFLANVCDGVRPLTDAADHFRNEGRILGSRLEQLKLKNNKDISMAKFSI